MSLKPLTEAQRKVFEFIKAFMKSHKYSPTVRDVMTNFGWSSPNGARGHLTCLRDKGYIDWNPITARSIQVLVDDKRGIPVIDLSKVTEA